MIFLISRMASPLKLFNFFVFDMVMGRYYLSNCIFKTFHSKGENVKAFAVILSLFLSPVLFAVTGGAGNPKSPTSSINTKTTAIGPAYTDGNNLALDNIQGASAFSVVNGSSLGTLGVAFPKGANGCNESGLTGREFTVPASSGIIIDSKQVAIFRKMCIRSKSSGSSLTSGLIDPTVW